MNSKSNLKEEVKLMEQRIDKLKKDLNNWENDVQEDLRRDRRTRERLIEKATLDFNNLKDQMNDKEMVFDEQINAVEKALESIEEISKSSPNIQS